MKDSIDLVRNCDKGGRARVLMSSFACEPSRGSEQEVGWRWALEMSRWFDVTVLTQTRNRPGIERELEKGIPSDRSLQFVYHQLPEPVYRMKSRFDPLTWPYYALWQRAIIKVAKKLHAEESFKLVHHVTFVSFRVPVWIKKMGIPVVFGPVGGADKAPSNLLGMGFGFKIRFKERVRNALTGIGAMVIKIFPPLAKADGICLAATPAMARIFDGVSLPNKVMSAVGMDPGELTQERQVVKDGLRFLFVGRFHPLKGTHLLIEAFARADIKGAQLTLVGGGADASNLRELAEQLGVGDQITWTGKLPRHELTSIYRENDVLVAPSLYESGGLVALEAMAQGMPAIVLDVGGHSISVADGCGERVSPDGPVDEVIDGLVNAMRGYCEAPERILADGKRAHLQVTNLYDWNHKAQQMKEIYEETMVKTLGE